MFSNLALIVRRPDVSRHEFRDHYEDIHAPLALPFMRGLRRYLRNHVQVALDDVEPGFDVLTQFTFESVEVAGRMQAVLKSEAGQVLREDEASFMDQPRNRFFAISQPNVVIDGTPRAEEFVKVAAAAKAPAGVDAAQYRSNFTRGTLAPLLQAGPKVLRCESHDVLGGPQGEPYDAVAFVWYARAGFRPGLLGQWKPDAAASLLLQVEECVTPLD
ncbi:MAG: EthD domain-containing protein [Deltaproteobacteria bacterium]|nr:EthD domain-containing protein [Deltaproteobacteria bacterium]MBW2359599.1 EthD domain-containing protein [Deltaproteobacteria bacterium]